MISDMYVVPEALLRKPEQLPLEGLRLENLELARYANNTVYALIEKFGLESADVALPIDWCRDFQETVGEWPVGHMVWSYDGNTFGEPVAITREGEAYLKIYKFIKEKK